jgi:hypothetical protein
MVGRWLTLIPGSNYVEQFDRVVLAARKFLRLAVIFHDRAFWKTKDVVQLIIPASNFCGTIGAMRGDGSLLRFILLS